MSTILWITSALLVMNAAHSYILLTANLEDVHAIAKQLAESPVADQIKRIWRRASNQFNMQVAKSGYQSRAQRDNEQEFNNVEDNRQDEGSEQSDEGRVERRQGEEVQGPDKNSSLYISHKRNA